MTRIIGTAVTVVLIALLLSACTKTSPNEVVFITPSGFSGQVHVQFGVAGAGALMRRGDAYVAEIPPDGTLKTSTLLTAAPKYRVLGGQEWGYSCSIFKTGDGIPVGARIELFIGTKEQYETHEAQKNKSQRKGILPTDEPVRQVARLS